jgi:hypothetical protein
LRGERVPKQTSAEATNGLLVTSGNRSDQKAANRELIGDLSRKADILTADIEHEEARVGVRDLLDPAYPVLARSLRARRENIGANIAMLEDQRA